MTIPYPALTASPRSGSEPFHESGRTLGFDLTSFWRWAASDLANNVWRGVLAEYLVARALGAADGPRIEWDVCDVRTDEFRVEVKSAAYLQTWHQRKLSAIQFDIAMKRGWDAATNTYAPEPCRGADVYVFALLAHQDKPTLDPMDLAQWQFYVAAARAVDDEFGRQKKIALSALARIAKHPVTFAGLRPAIIAAAGRRVADV